MVFKTVVVIFRSISFIKITCISQLELLRQWDRSTRYSLVSTANLVLLIRLTEGRRYTDLPTQNHEIEKCRGFRLLACQTMLKWAFCAVLVNHFLPAVVPVGWLVSRHHPRCLWIGTWETCLTLCPHPEHHIWHFHQTWCTLVSVCVL